MRGRLVTALLVALVATGCTVLAADETPHTVAPTPYAQPTPPAADTAPAPTVSPPPAPRAPAVVAYAEATDGVRHAPHAAVRALVERAEVVVTHDPVHARAAAAVALQLGVPAVPLDGAALQVAPDTPPDLVSALGDDLPVPWHHLGVTDVLHVGHSVPRLRGVRVHTSRASLPLVDVTLPTTPATVVTAEDDPALRSVVAVTGGTFVVARGDVRTDANAIALLAGTEGPVVGVDTEPIDDLLRHVRTARAGHTFPDGTQTLDDLLLVALYGAVDLPALGVLGEQDVPATIARARELAAPYQPHTTATVVPAMDLIVTVAAAEAGPDADYSREADPTTLLPLVEAAGAAGQYVVLDLQPGRQDFLSQAQQYTALLELPHVGLALDPEWRIGPTQRHLVQVGHVAAAEVQATADWLADLVAEHHLPQKLFLLHQFQLQMLRDRDTYDTSRDELSWVIQMDGQGGQFGKDGTWAVVTRDPPPGVRFGWKHFFDEDVPGVRSPEATLQLLPTPVFVSYQ